MAGSSEDQWRRHADEPEEGEIVPGPRGCHSESDTEEYYNHYSSESDDEATSNAYSHSVATNNGGDAGRSSSVAANDHNGYASSSSAAVAAPAPALACRVCGKEFTSTKAVCGHMKVHALDAHWRQEQGNGKKEKEVKRIETVERGWGFTGKRGFPGSRYRAVSPPNAEPESSKAIVAAEPKLVVLQPTPLAYAASNQSSVRAGAAPAKTDPSGEGSSAQQLIHDDAMAVAVAGADPPAEAVVHQQAAPLPAGAEAAPVHQHRAAPHAAGAQNPDGYTCAVCGMWFRTHQALGGHVAAHKSRRLVAAGTDDQGGAVPCRRGSKAKKPHVCPECFVEFPRGVQLGGHKRKHYRGPPIVPKKNQCLVEPVPPPADVVVPQLGPADVNMVDLSLALPVEADVPSPAPTGVTAQPAPSPAVEGTPKPTLAPRATGRVILFGIDIGLGVQKPTVQEDSPATKDDSLA